MEAHRPHYYNYYLFCDFTRIYKFFNRDFFKSLYLR